MNPHSRRDFIKYTSVGVAAAGAVSVAPAAATTALTAGDADAAVPPIPDDVSAESPVVAHVRNLRTGEVALYTGEREVRITDKRLARLLYHATH